uniref:Reverse transcriptase zinc-binding domain-containing protein n=1 Tax=Aegilops tauschii subsp. strangulata TaxID=200361 RepID=A0A453RBF6_AEGTS
EQSPQTGPRQVCPLRHSGAPVAHICPLKKTLQQLEKIQRGFLWAGRAVANGGHCHVNWRHVSRPLALGGLGVRDLERAGLALRLRWLWLSRTDEGRAWQGPDLQFSNNERTLFFASTYMTIGNGLNALFCEDRSCPYSTTASPNAGAKPER